MMTVDVNIPSGCRTTGRIYASADAAELSEDMLEVALPNDVLVSVGWFPEGDPAGEYRISTTIGLKHLIDSSRTRDPREAARIVEATVQQLCSSDPSSPTTDGAIPLAQDASDSLAK